MYACKMKIEFVGFIQRDVQSLSITFCYNTLTYKLCIDNEVVKMLYLLALKIGIAALPIGRDFTLQPIDD